MVTIKIYGSRQILIFHRTAKVLGCLKLRPSQIHRHRLWGAARVRAPNN